MRIISQKNCYSVEMEQVELFVNGNYIAVERNGKDKVLAVYPTNERTMEVWEELHEKYAGFTTPMEPDMFMYQMPKE